MEIDRSCLEIVVELSVLPGPASCRDENTHRLP